MKKTTSPYVKIKKSGIHNNGAFATKRIPKGTRIIEYVGEQITKKEADKRIKAIEEKAAMTGIPETYYIFTKDDKHDIDGDVPWNTAKWFNHSCDPNCESEDDEGQIWVLAKRDIAKGEELTYDYGFEFGEEGYENLICRCGSENCVGYIIRQKDWPALKKHLANERKTAKKAYKRWPVDSASIVAA